MERKKELEALLRRVEYKDWRFELVEKRGDALYLCVEFAYGDGLSQRGRKWYLSPHATNSEVLQTAFAAVLAAEEHEARESFRVDGEPCYGPHFDVDDLVGLARERGAAGARQPVNGER